MGVNQQQSTNNASTRDSVTQLLQSNLEQNNFSNKSTGSDIDKRYVANAKILKRLKRNPLIPIITVAVGKLIQKWVQKYAINALSVSGTAIGFWSWFESGQFSDELRGLITDLSGDVSSTKQNVGEMLEGLQGLRELITCKNEQVLGAIKQLADLKATQDFARQAVDNFEAIQDVSGQVAENHWAINRNYDLLLGNKNLLLANQGLLLANTGLLIGITFMLMITNSKLDRNYEAIKVVEGKVDRNYEAIRSLESKVDRNLEVMLLGLKTLECNLGNMMERGFREVINFVKHTKIEGVTSELITFIRHFEKEKDTIKSLTNDQYITKLEELNGILHRLQNSRMPQSGSLHTLLYNIINQRFAIPENSDDKISFTALGLLCSGTETYISVMSFLLEEYSYLADFYYQGNDVEKYNHYFSLVLTTFKDFKSSLAGKNGLISEVINILNEVKAYDFIKDEREDVVEFALAKIDDFISVKSQLIEIDALSQEKPTRKVKYNFSNSKVSTPIGKWKDEKKVAYAVQFQGNNTYYQVGEWSIPFTIRGKANPWLDIGTDPKKKPCLIFRKFDNDKPELVGIIEDDTQRKFRDINKDLYNAALEPNQNIAINEIETLVENGADVSAKYEIGRQAIHAVAENGNSNVMLVLINKGADINARDTNGYAPIHIAAEIGYEDFIKDLIDNGADVNAKTNFDWTALHIAAEKDHVSTVTNLMQSEGVDINAKIKGGFTSLHIAASFGKNNVVVSLSHDIRTDINAQSDVGLTSLHLASIGEYGDTVEILLKNNRVDINAKTKGGLTALHFASLIGNLEIVKFIVGHNGVNINEKSANGWTPLHLAIDSQKENVALELLSTDNIEITTKGKNDLTPLHLAASNGQETIVLKLLDKGASIEDVDKYNYTPLHFAIENGHLDVVKHLVERGANLYIEQKDGYTPLGLAAFNGKLDIVQFLVNNKEVNANTENKNGMTPIDFAASNGYFDIVEFLTDKGTDQGFALHWAAYGGHLNIVRYLADEKHFDLNKQDKYGNIPIHSAALRGHVNIVKYFVDEKEVDLNTENNNGYTPFLFAVLDGHLEAIKYFIDIKNIDLNSSPNKSDNNGSTALHLAALNSNLGVIKYLIRKGANVSAFDNYNNTPLFPTTSRGHLDMVKYLIQKGADFTVANTYGNTLLHFASWSNHFDIVKYFVEKGVDLNVANTNGDTPLHVAASLDISRYLVEKGANLRAISKDGCNSLHVAAAHGNLDIVKFLLKQGINIHTRVIKSNEKSNNGKTALHFAAQNGRIDVVEHLVEEGADVYTRNDSGKTPRDLAHQNSHTGVVKFLEEAQLNLNLLNAVKQGNFNKLKEYINQETSLKIKDKNGNTLQEIAARNGNVEMAEFLKQTELDLNLVDAVKQGNLDVVKECISKGASLEARDKNGHSLQYLAAQNYDIELFLIQAQLNLDLMNAIKQDNLDMVKYISRETSLDIMDKSGNTLLHLAASSGHLDTAKYLIEEGADFSAFNNDDSTPLHAAASSGKLNVVKYLIDEKGVGLEVTDKNDNTPLSLAGQGGHLDTVKYLVEQGASLSVTNKSGNTPIHEAASLDIVKYLIEKGANLNAVNRNSFTILHIAASHGKLDVAKYLVEEKGTNLEVNDNDGHSALVLAAQNGHLDIVKYLISKGADAFALGGYLDAVRTIVDERTVISNTHTNTKLKRLEKCKRGDREKGLRSNLRYSVIYEELYIHNNATRENVIIPRDFHYLCVEEDNSGGGRKLAFSNFLGNRFFEYKKYDPKYYSVSSECQFISTRSIETEKCFDLNDYSARHRPTFYLGQGSGDSVIIYEMVDVYKGMELQKIGILANEVNIYKQDDFCYTNYHKELVGHDRYSNEVTKDVHPTINSNGNTPLHAAALSGYLGIVKYFVEKGANLNVANMDGWTPLHIVAQEGYLDIVKYLIKKGADLKATDNLDANPLHLAAASGRLDVVKYLVDKGANVHTRMIRNNDGDSVLHLAAKSGNLDVVKHLIKEGAYSNDTDKYSYTPLYVTTSLDAAKYLLEEKEADLSATSNDGSTALHQAAYGGRLDIAKYFVEEKGDNLHATTNDGSTPLHQAAYNAKLDVVKYFIEEKGCSLNVEDNSGKTLLHTTAQEGLLDVVKYLAEKGADLNATDKFNHTSLHVAAAAGQLDMVKYFIEEKGVDINVKDSSGKIPLYFAVQEGKLDVVKYLVGKEANVNAKDNHDYAPLHFAARGGESDVVKYLVEKGADLNARSSDCDTALNFAAEQGELDIVKYLMEKGADLQISNKYGDTPLDSAALSVKNFLRQKQLNQLDLNLIDAVKRGNLDLVKEYVRKGASLDAKDKDGSTLLSLAAQNNGIVLFLKQSRELSLGLISAAEQGNLDAVKEYVNRGATLEAKSENGDTLLHRTALFGHLDVMKFLIEEGADVNVANKDGITPLHNAAYFGYGNYRNLAEYLVEKGADVNAADTNGITPLHMAAKSGNLDVVKYLVEKGVDLNAINKVDTLIYYAVCNSNLDIIKYFIEKGIDLKDSETATLSCISCYTSHFNLDLVKNLVLKDSNVNEKNGNDETLLLKAAWYGHLDIVKYLVGKGADVNAANKDGITPLHNAVRFGYGNYPDVAKYLVEKGADVNATNNNGITPLHKAAKRGNLEIVNYLIEKGANINSQDNNNKTPSDLALEHGNLEIADILQNRIRHRRHKQHHKEQIYLQEEHPTYPKSKSAHHSVENDNSIIKSNQATSGVSKPSSWINGLGDWIKEKGEGVVSNVVNRLYGDPTEELEGSKSGETHAGFKQSEKTSSATLPNVSPSGRSPVQGVLNANISNKGGYFNRKKVEGSSNPGAASPEGTSSTVSSISQVYAQPDINGLMLIPTFMTGMGKKFVLPFLSAEQPISPLEEQVHALNIIKGFKEVLEQQAALKDGIKMHRLDIDFIKVEEEITRKIMVGKSYEISGILKSYAEKACPGRERCPGKLSPKKFDKFMAEFNRRTDTVINQSIQLMVSRSEISNVKEQRISLEPKSYLNNTSVQCHLTRDKDSRNQSGISFSFTS